MDDNWQKHYINNKETSKFCGLCETTPNDDDWIFHHMYREHSDIFEVAGTGAEFL